MADSPRPKGTRNKIGPGSARGRASSHGDWAPPGADASDPFFSAVRAAVRAELGEFAAGACMREAVRSEVDAALQAWSGGPCRKSSRKSAPSDVCLEQKLQQPNSPPVTATKTAEETLRNAKNEFSSYLTSVKRSPDDDFDRASDDGGYNLYSHWLYKTWVWLLSVQEPERTGLLARFVEGSVFETIVCIVIFVNCAFMAYAADDEMVNNGTVSPSVEIGEWAFQIFYSVELALKLNVYRQFFFWREGWRLNLFDLVLVISGFVSLLGDSYFTGFWRVFRLLKFGKSIRAIKIMAKLEKLRAFLVCLHGSFASFFWSLVMLTTVYVLFGLFLMQVITSHVKHTGGDHADYDGLFGTVFESTLTLYMASTGGEDWSLAYRVIEETGATGTMIYLIFVAFVQFALINIITGIFVESAMDTLSPNSEARAMEHARREKAHAEELKNLCRQVDTDFSGKLTREQFEDGLRRKHIPRLLMLLQLQTHHVMEFFDTMSDVADDDGQVEIETFVRGCMQLKGPATNFDLQMFVAEFRAARQQQDKLLQQQENSLAELRDLLRE